MELMDINLDQMWEIVTFREFIQEESSTDEVIFFLWCRNMLFKGPQMRYNSCPFEVTHLIRWKHALKCLEIILERFDKLNSNFLIETLKKQYREKVTFENQKIFLIDSQLVLRTLLQYYRSEKLQIFRLLKELVMSQHGKIIKGNFLIEFDSFRKIFENNNFKGITELEKAQLYRECYAISKGQITHEVIFTVFHENNIFVKFLKLKMNKSTPIFNQNSQQFRPNCFESDLFQNAYGIFKNQNFIIQLTSLQFHVNQLGIEQYSRQNIQFIDFIQKNLSIDNDLNIQYKHIPQFFKDLFDKNLDVIFQVLSYYNDEDMEILYKIVINRLLDTLQYILKEVNSHLTRQKHLYDIRVTKKITLFQKFVKKKIYKWYQMLNNLIYTKVQMQQN